MTVMTATAMMAVVMMMADLHNHLCTRRRRGSRESE
jgi:hypothetical protein